LLPLTFFLLISAANSAAQHLEAAAAAQYQAEVTHVDVSKFPTVRVSIAVSDAQGKQIPDHLPVRLTLYENGQKVTETSLSSGYQVSTVLVIDTSGSMSGEKLTKAREAALKYISQSPSGSQTACVRFSNDAAVVSRFEYSPEKLRASINSLGAGGATALQDGIGLALDLLRGRTGRKIVVLLTDGLENASANYPAGSEGIARLLERSRREGDRIFTIGLGSDVDEQYLRQYQRTGGTYLFSPAPDELLSAFTSVVKLLEKERVVEYVSPSRELDGTVRNFRAELTVAGSSVSSPEVATPLSGVIPNVPAELGPYGLVFLVLLLAPPVLRFAHATAAVYRFRARSVRRLTRGSALVGRLDLNGQALASNDPVVVCPLPACGKTCHVRSWRLNRCRCLSEPTGGGNYCYSRLWPKWLRRGLYRWLGQTEGTDGRRWLCWCAGDEEGY
jgi:Mg-chelatase subunit ChlD